MEAVPFQSCSGHRRGAEPIPTAGGFSRLLGLAGWVTEGGCDRTQGRPREATALSDVIQGKREHSRAGQEEAAWIVGFGAIILASLAEYGYPSVG